MSCFSLIGQDSTKIQLSRPVAEVVAKGLIKYDGTLQELIQVNKELNLTVTKVLLKDSVINNLNSKVLNLQTIIEKKDQQLTLKQEQFNLEREKSDKLYNELKQSKAKNFLFKIGTYIGAGSLILLIIK